MAEMCEAAFREVNVTMSDPRQRKIPGTCSVCHQKVNAVVVRLPDEFPGKTLARISWHEVEEKGSQI